MLVDALDGLKADLILSKAEEEARIQQYNADMKSYKKWKQTLQDSVGELLSMARLKEDSDKLQQEVQRLEKEAAQYREKLGQDKKEMVSAKEEAVELRSLLDASKRWLEDAARIAAKKNQVLQKLEGLTEDTGDGGRDLETMERDLAEKVEQKDANMMKINELNGEMTTLNNIVTDLATKVSSNLTVSAFVATI